MKIHFAKSWCKVMFGIMMMPTLILSSCSDDKTELPTPTPVIKVSQTEISVDFHQHDQTVAYSIENAAADAIVKVNTDASWIKNITATVSEVKFNIEMNEAKENRTGELTLSYDRAENVVVKITQSFNDVEPSFLIEVSEIGAYGATVTYTPQDFSGNYLFLVAKASTIDKYIDAGNLEGWIEGDIEWLKSIATNRGVTLEQFLPSYTKAYCTKGEPTTISYSGLEYNTEYYAYCYGLTPQAEVTTEFFKEKFTTQITNMADLKFEFKAEDISTTGAMVTVTPSNDNDTYTWTYISEMEFAQYDLLTIQDNMIKNIMLEVQYGVDINNFIHKGASSENIKGIWAGTNYHIVAWGMDSKGSPTTEPVDVGTFRTLDKEEKVECSFTIDCPQVLDNDIQVHIVPTDNDIPYYVALVDVDKCTNYTDNQMAQRLINMENSRFAQGFYGAGKGWDNVDWVLYGEQTKWGRKDLEWTFSPNRTYRVFVFGVSDVGERLTAVYSMDVTTKAGQRSDLTFKVDIVKEDWNMVTYHITPSKTDEYYMPFLIETKELQYVCDANGNIDEAKLCHEITHYYDETPNYYTLRGERDWSGHWISDTDYTLLLCGWSGGNTTEFFRYETHTPAIPFGQSTADVEVKYELFDAKALMELDKDRWKDYEGMVVINLTYTPNADCAHWYSGVWMPYTNYLSTGGYQHLLTLILNPDISICDRYTAMYRTLTFGETYSLSTVAVDADGKFGPWHYTEFTPKRDVNMTEPYDFWTKRSSNSRIMVMNPKTKAIKDLPEYQTIKPAMRYK